MKLRRTGRTVRVTKFSGSQVYDYCRVRLPKGEMAWSSPIWIADRTG